MTTHFASDIDWVKAFYLRTDSLRPEFGHWDACDPVCHAILDLVEAQTEIAAAIEDDCTYNIGGDAAIQAAVKKRSAAACKFMAAIMDRESWPYVLR